METIIRTLLYEWKERKLPSVLERGETLLPFLSLKPRKIVAITGFRRVGKTYLLFHTIQHLLQKLTREEVIYLNFEDERIPPTTEFLTLLLPTLRAECSQDIKYLFLDEIQRIPGWSTWLRRIYDMEDLRLFVTGSSSKLSSKEIPTELRGRAWEVVVFPLSLQEFLSFNDFVPDQHALSVLSKHRTSFIKLFKEYTLFGGLPEVVLSPEEKKQELAQLYYRAVVQREILERFSLKSEEVLKALLQLLLNSLSYTFTKVYNTLRSLHFSIGKVTLQHYIAALEASYFFYSVPVFSYKVKDRMQLPRKGYWIDPIFIRTLSVTSSSGLGRLYENLVFLELLRRKKETFYWKDRQQQYEVDFVVLDKGKPQQLIQVAYALTDEATKVREIRALLTASAELHCRNLLLLTQEEEGEERKEWFGISRTVTVMPLWKWLLNQPTPI